MISLFIPTIPNHIKFLDEILFTYLNKSTVIPEEIVVSVSNYATIPPDILLPIIEKYQNVKFILHDKVMLAGPNRQVSKDFCSGDIIVYHDSDDLPHIQRLEIIKHFFDNYDISHLNHSYDNKTEYNEDLIDVSKINFITSEVFNDYFFPNNILEECTKIVNGYGYDNFPSHGGAIAIKKEVLNHVKWKDRGELNYSPGWDNYSYKGAEDYEFNMETTFLLKQSMMIDSKCYFYAQ
jgi:hypothetical protein